MSGPNPAAAVPPNSWHMVRALGGIGVLCSLLIAVTFQQTLPVITRNRAAALEKAVFRVLPGAKERASYLLDAEGRLRPAEETTDRGQLIYAGYDEAGRLVGIAIEASGQGFQDVIRLLYGYSPQREQVIGMEVLESKETPGLGDKIMKDPAFLANFAALEATLTGERTGLLNPLEVVKSGSKQHPWQIDGITGATISSKAIGAIIGASAERVLPILVAQIDRLEKQPNE